MGQLYSHLVFRPPQVCTYQPVDGKIKYVVPDDNGLPAIHSTDLIWLLNSMGFRIPCVFIRQPRAEYVAIYAHQNAEDLGTSVRDAHLLSHRLGIDVLAFEYSGYGLSERPPRSQYASSRSVHGHAVKPSMLDVDRTRSTPSEKACCSDIIAAYNYLTDQCAVHPSKIIIFGRSLGSGPAVYCAATRNVAGLVLIAPIASAVRVPLKRLNVTLPFIDTFPNIDRASKIRCPVLVVHGDMDELVPKVHAEKLFGKIQQHGHAVNPLWIPTARHNNIVEDYHSIVFSRYLTFLDEVRALHDDRRSLEAALLERVSRSTYINLQNIASPTASTSSLPPPPLHLPAPSRARPTVATSSSHRHHRSRPRRSRRIPCIQGRPSLDNLSMRAKNGEDAVGTVMHAIPCTAPPKDASSRAHARRSLELDLDMASDMDLDLDFDMPPSIDMDDLDGFDGPMSLDAGILAKAMSTAAMSRVSSASPSSPSTQRDDDDTDSRMPTHSSLASSVPDVPPSHGPPSWRQLSLIQCIHPNSHHSPTKAGPHGKPPPPPKAGARGAKATKSAHGKILSHDKPAQPSKTAQPTVKVSQPTKGAHAPTAHTAKTAHSTKAAHSAKTGHASKAAHAAKATHPTKLTHGSKTVQHPAKPAHSAKTPHAAKMTHTAAKVMHHSKTAHATKAAQTATVAHADKAKHAAKAKQPSKAKHPAKPTHPSRPTHSSRSMHAIRPMHATHTAPPAKPARSETAAKRDAAKKKAAAAHAETEETQQRAISSVTSEDKTSESSQSDDADREPVVPKPTTKALPDRAKRHARSDLRHASGPVSTDGGWHSFYRNRMSFPMLRACKKRFEQDVERDSALKGASPVSVTLQLNPSWQALQSSIEHNARVQASS